MSQNAPASTTPSSDLTPKEDRIRTADFLGGAASLLLAFSGVLFALAWFGFKSRQISLNMSTINGYVVCNASSSSLQAGQLMAGVLAIALGAMALMAAFYSLAIRLQVAAME